MRDITTPDECQLVTAAWDVIKAAATKRDADTLRHQSGSRGPSDLTIELTYGLWPDSVLRTARYGEPDCECVELEFGTDVSATPVQLHADPATWLVVGRRILDAFEAVGLDIVAGVDRNARSDEAAA